MKNIWQKIPAWLKAILLTIVCLYPITIVNQTMLQLNLLFFPQVGISLFFVAGSLYVYWRLAKRWNPFRAKEDISLSVKVDFFNRSSISSIIGLVTFTISVISLGFVLFGVSTADSQQMAYIQTFFQAPPTTAVPLLLILAVQAGVVEEITFRGFVQNTVQSKYARLLSYLLVGILFSLLHFLPWQLVIPYTLVSIAFSVVADRQKSIGLVLIAHTLTDMVAFMMHYLDIAPFYPGMGVLRISIAVLLMLGSVFLIIGWKPKQRFALS